MAPVKCPVCEGRQTVEAGFYRDKPLGDGPQPCRTCHGAGYLWAVAPVPQPTALPQVPYVSPFVPYYPPYIVTWQGQGNTGATDGNVGSLPRDLITTTSASGGTDNTVTAMQNVPLDSTRFGVPHTA